MKIMSLSQAKANLSGLVEDVARTVHIAYQGGTPKTIAPQDIDSLYARYQNDYGQTEGITS